MAERKQAMTADGIVARGRGLLKSIIVTTVLGAGTVTVFDGVTAAGTVLHVIPATTAAGVVYSFGDGIPFTTGLFADFVSTGTVLFVFD